MENNSIKDVTNVLDSVTAMQAQKISYETPSHGVFICDECGDTMWDAVLAQDEAAQALKNAITDSGKKNK